MTDPVLMAVASGDASAFARWLATAEPRLRASLHSWATVIDIEAVVQETLLRVWQVAPRAEPHPEGETLERLAIRIGRNLAVDHGRRLRTLQRRFPDGPPDEPTMWRAADVEPDPWLRDHVARCREKLPKKPRQALDQRLHDAGARSDHELAAAVRMRVNTFLQNLSRARRLLAECLRRAGVEVPG